VREFFFSDELFVEEATLTLLVHESTNLFHGLKSSRRVERGLHPRPSFLFLGESVDDSVLLVHLLLHFLKRGN
jgi:hypothetical protein